MQELECPALERGRRRGGLLIAGEAVHDVWRDRGPAGELGLERRDRGDGSRGGADPQEAGVRVILDGRIERLREERDQRVVPADDHRQAWVLCGDAVATHRHLAGWGWWEAVWRDGDGQPWAAFPERPGARHAAHGVCIGRVPWWAWVLRTAAALAGGERTGPCAAPRRGSLAFAVAAIGELVAKPAGAAGVAVVPAHRDLVLGTPARVVVVRAGEALGFRRLGRRRRGALRAWPLVLEACAFMAAATAAAICSSSDRAWAWRSSSACWRLRSASCWRAARLASQPCRISWSQGRLMVARRWSFRSSTSRMVNMSSMLPILSLMLSEAGASLIGQLAVLGAASVAGWC